MMESLLAWLKAEEGPLSYAVLALAAMLEYVVPPVPGDTITLFGAFLASTAGYSVTFVFLSITGGSIVGSVCAYAVGVRLATPGGTRAPAWLRGRRAAAALAAVCDRFQRHGPWLLVLNRFLPAMRAFFFVAAGMAKIPLWQIIVYGGLSSIVWNALLVALASAIGANWPRLLLLSKQYAALVLVAVAAVGFALAFRWWRRTRVCRSASNREDS